jgi:hypothetical protein
MSSSDKAILSQFQLENGTLLGGPVEIPLLINIRQLNSVANGLVQAQPSLAYDHNDVIPYTFYIDDIEIKESLEKYFQDQTNKQKQDFKLYRLNDVPQQWKDILKQ